MLLTGLPEPTVISPSFVFQDHKGIPWKDMKDLFNKIVQNALQVQTRPFQNDHQWDLWPLKRSIDHSNWFSAKTIALDIKINGNQYPLNIYCPMLGYLNKELQTLPSNQQLQTLKTLQRAHALGAPKALVPWWDYSLQALKVTSLKMLQPLIVIYSAWLCVSLNQEWEFCLFVF